MLNILKAFDTVKSNLNASMVRLALDSFSLINYVKSMFQKDLVVINKEYQTGSVLLLALYEKGELRSDIKKLLKSAKEKKLYIVAVNTRKLSPVGLNAVTDLIDVYIQQYNFGRDFGSYKKGFSYIYKSGLSANAPKVLMLNDSVYYDSTRVGKFIEEMLDDAYEVKGATENFEINYHLGSFAICFDRVIVNNKKFKAYWQGYRRSDVRPFVIKNGEMALSKVLRKIVSAEVYMGACYNSQRVRSFLKSESNLDGYLNYLRKLDKCWPTVSLRTMYEEFLGIYGSSPLNLLERHGENNKTDSIENKRFLVQNSSFPYTYITSKYQLIQALSLNAVNFVGEGLEEKWASYLVSKIVENSRLGSQIHQNGPCYFYMGMAIVKLDGLYRGMFNDLDIESFRSLMTEENFEELETLLNQKPSGFDTLEGWKLDAFRRGLI